MKQRIAILLAALLVLSLTACGKSGTGAISGGLFGGGEIATADSIVGTWQFKLNFGKEQSEPLLDIVIGCMQLGYTPTAEQKAEILGSLQEGSICSISGTFTFRDDGTMETNMDDSAADEMAAWELAILPSALKVLLPRTLELRLAEQGIDEGVEDYVYRQTGLHMDAYIESYVEYLKPSLKTAMAQACEDLSCKTSYELREGKLYLWTDANPEGQTQGGVSCEMLDEKLRIAAIDEIPGADQAWKSLSVLLAGFLPLELTRVE